MAKTVREIIRRRDDASDSEVNDMFEDLSIMIAGGDEPEDALAEVFGLEPDYLLEDDETFAAVEAGFRQRRPSLYRLRDTEGDSDL